MIVFGAGRAGRTSLGLFLPCPPRRKVSPFTSGGGGGGGCVMFRPSPSTSPVSGSAVSDCPDGEGRRLDLAACGNLSHQWILTCSAVAVLLFSLCSELALGERYVQLMSSTMCVAHTFEVVLQKEVAAVVYLGDFYPILRRCVDGSPDPKPRPYLHLWGGVWIVLLHMVTPLALRLEHGGVLFRRWCRLQAACCRGWEERALWRCQPPWEGDQFRPKISSCKSPSEALKVWPPYPLLPLQLLE